MSTRSGDSTPKMKNIPSENVIAETESVVNTNKGDMVCETEVLNCSVCEYETLKSSKDTICPKCLGKDPKNKNKLKLLHFLHNPITGKWKKSTECSK